MSIEAIRARWAAAFADASMIDTLPAYEGRALLRQAIDDLDEALRAIDRRDAAARRVSDAIADLERTLEAVVEKQRAATPCTSCGLPVDVLHAAVASVTSSGVGYEHQACYHARVRGAG